ncbi:MAG TPA: exodeoxyribonuclease VII small subunit [Marinobacterium sp.]|nr:exodeoxyribonuclease VII small subunit [Marinobacterium sp.]
MSDNKAPADFETSLKRLESLVTQMEQGDLPIEDALKAFEEGIGLTRECQAILDQAEQKVQVLVENRGTIEAQPLGSQDTD